MRKTRAFTLIELLIVMAILTLLAGILFTVFAGAKEKARQTHCMNNLKQLGAAILLYKQDYDGGWPPEARALFPHYVADKQVFVCPDDCTPQRERRRIDETYTPYCSYDRGTGDYLPTLSGWALEQAMASFNCDLKAKALAERAFLARLPVLVCLWHLLPGADVPAVDFNRRLVEAEIQAPALVLRQDGSVDRLMVPSETGGYLDGIRGTGVHGYTLAEWIPALKRAREQLRASGHCTDEEEEGR